MAVVSSHILDSVIGKSACGIRVELVAIKAGSRQLVFDKIADDEGRIHESVKAEDCEYELIFHAADYFALKTPVVSSVVIRFKMHDLEARYHMPVMLSPHSYSTWWSE